MKDKKEMNPYVVRLSSEYATGLGVVTSDYILTCAHFAHYFGVDKRNPRKMSCVFACEKPDDYYAQSQDCLLDFMVLGEAPFCAKIENSSAMPEIDPPIKPVQLVFPVGVDQIKLPVYIYAPDGKTVWHTTARVYRDQFWFELHHTIIKGCIGGPVFTEDHRLIGCVMGHEGLYDNEFHCAATRIDLAAPGWLRAWLGGFDDLRLAEYAVEEKPSKADKWAVESYFIGKSLQDIQEVYVGCA